MWVPLNAVNDSSVGRISYFDCICLCPGRTSAISRWLSGATPPVYEQFQDLHPERMPESLFRQINFVAMLLTRLVFLESFQDSRKCRSTHPVVSLTLNHRLIAAVPSGTNTDFRPPLPKKFVTRVGCRWRQLCAASGFDSNCP